MIVSKKSNIDVDEMVEAYSASSAAVATAAALLGANLVVLALSWDHPPTEGGIVTITFLMMISFVAFITVLHQTMRGEYIISLLKRKIKKEKVEEKDYREMYQIIKWTRNMHIGGLLFTTIAFWVISYKYLISIEGYHLVILLLPFILFILYWIPKLIGVEKEVSWLAVESLIQVIVQVVFLVLICLDFFKILTIP